MQIHYLLVEPLYLPPFYRIPKRGVSHDPRLVVWEHLRQNATTTLRRRAHRKRLVGDAADVFGGPMARTEQGGDGGRVTL